MSIEEKREVEHDTRKGKGNESHSGDLGKGSMDAES